MRVLVFGATGMVGQGVLRECLIDPRVSEVVVVGRRPTGVTHARLRELIQPDLMNLAPIEAQLSGFDACFFCLGVSSFRMSEADYARITHELTLRVAELLARLNSQMTFVYVTGTGTDSTEKGRVMWARVKGRTENELLRLPFKAAYMFRPGVIQPMHGERPRTQSYAWVFPLLGWLFPVARWAFPKQVTTTEEMGRAMLAAVEHGLPKRVLEPPDIIAAGRQASPPSPPGASAAPAR